VTRNLNAIPEVRLGEILGGRRPTIRLFVRRYEDGILPNEHAMSLLSILVAEAPMEVLEIGTYMGHTTANGRKPGNGNYLHRRLTANLLCAVRSRAEFSEGGR
jgi:hypothetical protein